jgi:S1-C subfamily serine protease
MTATILGVVILLLVSYDVWAYVTGRADTITAVIRRASAIVPFLAGVVAGHLFWCVVVLAIVLGGCAHGQLVPAATVTTPAEIEARRGVDDMLSVIGRFTIAHACPVETAGGRFLLTNAHVVDERPFDATIGAFPVRWSDGSGNEGLAVPERVLVSVDLAFLHVTESSGPIARWYPIAAFAPSTGDRVSVLGYRWEGRDHVLEQRRVTAKVTRVVAGHAVYDEGARPGSSGSCVLNDRDEVVGVNAWQIPAGLGEAVGVAVGIWGIWAPRADMR